MASAVSWGGKTGEHCWITHGVQFSFPSEHEKDIKKIFNLLGNTFDSTGVTKETTLTIYDLFIQKHEAPVYKNMPASQLKKIKAGRDSFKDLPLLSQCQVLQNILGLFACRKDKNSDLTLIGGAQNAGAMKIPMDITKFKSALMINESPTGLTSQVIDLKKVQPK